MTLEELLQAMKIRQEWQEAFYFASGYFVLHRFGDQCLRFF